MSDSRRTESSPGKITTSGFKPAAAQSPAFRANAHALRKRMAAERVSRQEQTRRRKPDHDQPQNPTQTRPFAEASYGASLAIRGTQDWYQALCRRLAVLDDTTASLLIADPRTVVMLTKRYESCFQRGIVRAVQDFVKSLDGKG